MSGGGRSARAGERLDGARGRWYSTRGPVAQLVEQETFNLTVRGSSPRGLTDDAVVRHPRVEASAQVEVSRPSILPEPTGARPVRCRVIKRPRGGRREPVSLHRLSGQRSVSRSGPAGSGASRRRLHFGSIQEPREKASPENRRDPNVKGAEMPLPGNSLWIGSAPIRDRETLQENRIPVRKLHPHLLALELACGESLSSRRHDQKTSLLGERLQPTTCSCSHDVSHSGVRLDKTSWERCSRGRGDTRPGYDLRVEMPLPTTSLRLLGDLDHGGAREMGQ